MPNTQVILKEQIKGLGAEADVVSVKRGFARNFLLPQGKAYEATKGNLLQVKNLKAKRAEREAKEISEAQSIAGKIKKLNLKPSRTIRELRLSAENTAKYEIGATIKPSDIFAAGQKVDVMGTSKGKGFAGVMKRHNFKGVSASHGAHRNHRKPGSIGASSTPSRVFKGMRMAGRMGGERVTVLNLKVHAVDAEKGLLLVKGAVPGARGRLVFVRNAVKGAN